MYSEWEIVTRTREFAVTIVAFAGTVNIGPVLVVLIRQLIKAGTSVGANVEEAQDASSRRDFVQKMLIALKEARETRYWLRILYEVGLIKEEKYDALYEEITEIARVLTTIIKRTRGS